MAVTCPVLCHWSTVQRHSHTVTHSSPVLFTVPHHCPVTLPNSDPDPKPNPWDSMHVTQDSSECNGIGKCCETVRVEQDSAWDCRQVGRRRKPPATVQYFSFIAYSWLNTPRLVQLFSSPFFHALAPSLHPSPHTKIVLNLIFCCNHLS